MMFTGIIEETGRVAAVRKSQKAAQLDIRAEKILSDVRDGDSIAVNGVCLTVTSHTQAVFTADVMPETMSRSTLSRLTVGMPVNLERAMPANGRFGGHLVTGHIDGTGIIRQIRREEMPSGTTSGQVNRCCGGLWKRGRWLWMESASRWPLWINVSFWCL